MWCQSWSMLLTDIYHVSCHTNVYFVCVCVCAGKVNYPTVPVWPVQYLPPGVLSCWFLCVCVCVIIQRLDMWPHPSPWSRLLWQSSTNRQPCPRRKLALPRFNYSQLLILFDLMLLFCIILYSHSSVGMSVNRASLRKLWSHTVFMHKRPKGKKRL